MKKIKSIYLLYTMHYIYNSIFRSHIRFLQNNTLQNITKYNKNNSYSYFMRISNKNSIKRNRLERVKAIKRFLDATR